MTLRRAPSVFLLLPLLGACVEYEVVPTDKGSLPGETGLIPDTSSPIDTDIPAACPPEDDLPTEVLVDESCFTTAITGSIEAVVEWSYSELGNYGEYNEILGTPVVGQLTDDNGDGEIDTYDFPDIVFVADDHGSHNHRKGILRIMPGDGLNRGQAISEANPTGWQVYPYRYSNTALGDIDGDGVTEIVIIAQVMEDMGGGDGGGSGGGGMDTAPPDGGGGEAGGGTGGDPEDNPVLPPPPLDENMKCAVSAWNANGELEWMASEALLTCAGHAPSLADLDGDGDVEVVVGPYVFDGASGGLLAQGSAGQGFFPSNAETGMHSAVADLDGDGQQEIIAGPTRYAADGSEVCTASGVDDGFVAVADLDMDGAGEWVVTANGTVTVIDSDCTVMESWPLSGGGNGGPPTIADFDADGAPEIGIADAGYYAVYEATGAALWSQPITDASSHTTGSSVYDFEGDGYPEVVYADETRLWIFAGATGEVRLEDPRHASRTLHEYPTIADIDRDGSSEIIVPNGGGHNGENLTGLYILGPAEGVWLMSRQVWNQHAYSLTNINDDLSIPSPAQTNWPLHNNFRSGDPNPVSAGKSADAVPLGEVCTEACESGLIGLRVRVGNAGLGGLRFGLPLSVYSEESDGTRTLIAQAWSGPAVDAGSVSDAIDIRLDPADIPDGIVVIVADLFEGIGWVPECHEDNNELRIEGVVCP